MSLTQIKKPTLINLPITEVCDSKCVMCNIWNDDKEDAFLPDILRKKFNDPFYSDVKHLGISGGEPTLNPKLYENIEVIVTGLKLKSLSMTSHGFHTDKHKILLPKIKELCEKHNVRFGLNISLDGIDEVHLKIRRIKDAYKKTTATAFYAKSIGIPVQLQTTVSRDNVYNIVKVREFAIKNGFESIFRVATEISRLYNEDLQEGIALNKKQKSFFADFLQSERTITASYSVGRRLFYSDLSKRLTTGANRIAPCSFQSTGLFLSPVGDIYNCSLSETALEVDSNNLEESIKSNENSKILNNLIKNKCNTCLHDQSGRWELYHYLKVHDKTRKFYLKGMKLYRALKLTSQIFFNSIKKDNSISISEKTNKILIIGMYGGEHVGDAAILGGVILRLIERFNFTNIDVLSIRKDRTECWVENLDLPVNINVIDNNVEVNPYNYDRLVLAGGPIMNIPTVLINHLKIINRFKKVNKPFLIEGVGYGPLKTKLSKFLAKKIISKSEEVSLRTKEDFQKVIKFRKDSIETHDPAFDYLKYHLKILKESNDKFLNKILKEDKKICVINLRPSDKTYTTSNGVVDSEDKMLNSLVNYLEKNSIDMKYVFMPMNSDQFGFCDFEIAYKLEDKIKERKINVDYSIWETETTINDCLLLLNKASLTISMRFHGCIFSLSTGTPTIGIDYSTIEKGKVYNLFKNIQKENQVINLNNFQKNSIINIAKDLI
jgi:MoaA/NifB/PqqE/SkfB family radical SAM enzyme/polysaccharide pyruvyl transferase WcaK-like protein